MLQIHLNSFAFSCIYRPLNQWIHLEALYLDFVLFIKFKIEINYYSYSCGHVKNNYNMSEAGSAHFG